MRNFIARTLAILFLSCMLTMSGFAQQDKEQKKLKSASLDGATGLFKTWDAETLRSKEFNFSLGYDHYNRDPGELVIKRIPLAFALGLTNRIEFFGSFDTGRKVTTTGSKTWRLLPGQMPRPATSLIGVTTFSNEAPFIDVPKGGGRGDFNLGVKVGLFSERRGDPLAVSFVGFMKGPGTSSKVGLNKGLSTGQVDGGFGFLFSKQLKNIATLHLNTLLDYVGDPAIVDQQLADLQNKFIYRAGASFPAGGIFELIAELNGTDYFGSKTAGLNPKNPLDLIFGLRAYPKDWVSVGLGYQASLNHVKENPAAYTFPAGTNGLVAQLAFGRRHNDPPTVTCVAAKMSIVQDETTTIRANAKDPDSDPLKFSWSASGGKINGSGDTAIFDAHAIAPGKYAVTVTVSDGKHEATCTVEITVIKKNLAPSISCDPGSASILAGESATIRATASDPNNDKLSYSWTVNGQKLAADTSSIVFGSEGRPAGAYSVAVTVSDGEFTATCASTVTIRAIEKVNAPPRIEALTPNLDVGSGGNVELRARGTDPDNDRLIYTWTASAGSVSGSGETASFNATGLKAGTYTVTATADDGKGGKASCTMTINVSERVSLVSEGKIPCGGFLPSGARVDNCAKAALDDLAVRMKNDPKLMANVIGYTDGSRQEASAKNLGAKRSQAVVAYLTKKGVDAAQLKVTDGGANNLIGDNKTAAGRKKNRRVEIELAVH